MAKPKKASSGVRPPPNALCMLRTNVVSANAASPSGAGSATDGADRSSAIDTSSAISGRQGLSPALSTPDTLLQGPRLGLGGEWSIGTAQRLSAEAERLGCQTRQIEESSQQMTWGASLGAQAGLTGLAALFVYLLLRRQRRGFGTLEQRATLRTLAFATTTLSILRRGLTASTASTVLPSVAEQAGAAAVALYDENGLLGYHPAPSGGGDGHRQHLDREARVVLQALIGGRLKLVQVHHRRRYRGT